MDFKEYFNTQNLTKTPGGGLHYEQKTTPDLIWCVAHVVSDITAGNKDMVFSDKDIRDSKIFNALMQDYFSKAPQEQAENEYNKVSSYQLGLLAFAGILKIISNRPKKYKIESLEAINFISVNDLNASKFLAEYTEKFLFDNGLISVFEQYKSNPNQDNHLKAKDAYWEWAKINTGVRGDDRRHTYRVFNKIFNVYCNKHRIPGEDASNITLGPCPYSFLIYNRKNFRDQDMPSGMTRQQYKKEILDEIDSGGVVATLLKKAKEAVRSRHINDSEVKDISLGYEPNSGVHVHHILPQHSYSQFSLSRENLIALTPGQHLSRAHIEASTRTINSDFQKICLKQKFQAILESTKLGDGFYNLSEFIKIINTCFDWNVPENSSLKEVGQRLNQI
jgi:hypothetical protein